jgi:hypothetical protein
MIRVWKVGDLYAAEASPPHVSETWETASPLTPTELLSEMANRGCHSTDATDALDASGGEWRPVHDAEVWRRRAEPWLEAGKDLGIKVEAPFSLSGHTGIALVPSFGSDAGTLILPLDREVSAEVILDAKSAGYFVTRVNLSTYGTYARQPFIDTLNDWGWFGSTPPPSWYSGRPWSR